jgi:hypothetical protein
MDDPEAYGEVDVRFLQPYQANKWYVCPNCNRDIEPGTGHYAIVPKEAPDLRRHWHRGCWDGRKTRARRRRGVSTRNRAVAARSERRFDDLDAWTGDRGDIESETAASAVGVEP